VDRRAVAACGREAPLPDRVERAPVETGAEAAQHAHVAHRPVATHDDLENDFALDVPAPRLVRVGGAHLVDQRRRRDSGARPVRPAAGSAAAPLAETRPLTFPGAGAGP